MNYHGAIRTMFLLSVTSVLGCRPREESAAIKTEASQTHWNYQEQSHWPSLCLTGHRQSPIEISPALLTNAKIRPTLTPQYPDQIPMKVLDNSHTIEVTADQNTRPGGLLYDDKLFQLAQFHFHMPAEHVIKGERRSDLEVHFVHKHVSPEGKTTAIALGFLLSSNDFSDNRKHPNSSFDEIFREVDKDCGHSMNEQGFHCKPVAGTQSMEGDIEYSEKSVVAPVIANLQVPVKQMIADLIRDNTFIAYEGSLTTPGCDEIVTHIVGVREIQVPALIGRTFVKTGYDNSARNIQPVVLPNDVKVRKFASPRLL